MVSGVAVAASEICLRLSQAPDMSLLFTPSPSLGHRHAHKHAPTEHAWGPIPRLCAMIVGACLGRGGTSRLDDPFPAGRQRVCFEASMYSSIPLLVTQKWGSLKRSPKAPKRSPTVSHEPSPPKTETESTIVPQRSSLQEVSILIDAAYPHTHIVHVLHCYA